MCANPSIGNCLQWFCYAAFSIWFKCKQINMQNAFEYRTHVVQLHLIPMFNFEHIVYLRIRCGWSTICCSFFQCEIEPLSRTIILANLSENSERRKIAFLFIHQKKVHSSIYFIGISAYNSDVKIPNTITINGIFIAKRSHVCHKINSTKLVSKQMELYLQFTSIKNSKLW